MFWKFEYSIFWFSASFWVTKQKSFFGKVTQRFQNYLNKNLVIGSFLKNALEAIFSSKTIVLGVWKEHSSGFCKPLMDEVESFFCESETKRSKLFKWRLGHSKLLRKWFWDYLQLQSKCFEHLKRAFFNFLQIFKRRSWNHFLGKWSKLFKII